MASMVADLFGKLCSLISTGAQKLVHYVCNVAKATYEFVSRIVSESLSRLRNICTLLKGSLSSAMNYVKEKSLEGIKFIMKWVLQLFQWFIDELAALFAGLKDASKSGSESELSTGFEVVLKSCAVSEANVGFKDVQKSCEREVKTLRMVIFKATIFILDNFLPAYQDMRKKRGVVNFPIGSFVTDLINLCEKQRNTTVGNCLVDVAQDFLGLLGPLMTILTSLFDAVCDNIDD